MGEDEGYLLENQQVQSGTRFAALSALFDASTFRHFETVGIDEGWRCWEIGAGGPTVPEWLADRDAALRSMVHALRPGGWLLVEDADPALQPLICPDEHGPEQELANRLRRGFRKLLQQRGADLAYGRRLPRLLRQAGLADVEADAYFPRHLARLRRPRDGHRPAGARQTHRGGPRHGRGDRAAPRQRRLGAPRPRHLTHDLGLGPPPFQLRLTFPARRSVPALGPVRTALPVAPR